jgi:GT2 family glycosyltransferase
MDAAARELVLPWRPRPAPAPSAAAVDVVVPVHGAAAVTREALAAIVVHTDLRRHRLRIVEDASPDRDLIAWLVEFAAERTAAGERVELVRHARNRGFVASANEGLAAAAGDAVLVNSDTRVGPGWLDRLAAAAATAPDVASVTPFSNNATLGSLPEPFVDNPLPAGLSVDAMAELVARVSPHRLPELPTAVGFCMYVRGAAWRAVGPFDEGAFGAGYGEENDWSMRARRAGWRHLLDDATFVFHLGGASFGGLRRRLAERRARRVLVARWPDYEPAIARFMREEPLAAHRELVRFALAGRGEAIAGPVELRADGREWRASWRQGGRVASWRLPRLEGEARPAAELVEFLHRAIGGEVATSAG